MLFEDKGELPADTVAKHVSPETETERPLLRFVSRWKLLGHQLSLVPRPARVTRVDVSKGASDSVCGKARVVPLWARVGVLAATTNLVAVKLMSRVIILIIMLALVILMGFHRPPTQSLPTHRLKTCRIRSQRCSGPCTRDLRGT